MTSAGTPKSAIVRCQPIVASSPAPSSPEPARSGTRIVPRFPPAMWALMAKPRRSGGKASERNAFPTGCCGLAPMREALIPASSCPIDAAVPAKSRLTPKTSWPAGEEQRARDVAGHEAVGELHEAADRGGDGDERADVGRVQRELDDDDRVHQGHERREGVDDGVAGGQEDEREHRPPDAHVRSRISHDAGHSHGHAARTTSRRAWWPRRPCVPSPPVPRASAPGMEVAHVPAVQRAAHHRRRGGDAAGRDRAAAARFRPGGDAAGRVLVDSGYVQRGTDPADRGRCGCRSP